MKNLVTFLVACLFALTASCSSVHNVSYDYDKQTNFAGLITYDWLPVPQEIKVDTLVQNRIKNAVNSELQAKGLKMTSVGPDFLIAMHAGTEERVRYTPEHYGYKYGNIYRRDQYEEGTLVLDFVDPSTKELIWRGTAKAYIDSKMTPARIEKLIDEAVEKTLKNFPPPAPK